MSVKLASVKAQAEELRGLNSIPMQVPRTIVKNTISTLNAFACNILELLAAHCRKNGKLADLTPALRHFFVGGIPIFFLHDRRYDQATNERNNVLHPIFSK
jgi:hypothetical protein